MKNPSNLNTNFSRVQGPNIQRSVFNRTTTHKFTIDEGYLYPIFIDEILPGDTINMDAHVVARLSTLDVPVMDNMYLDMHWWFVPNRLVWEHWETFMSGYSGRGEETDYEIPQLDGAAPTVVNFDPFSIYDYMGLPINQDIDVDVYGISALPFRAYNLIWNEWYRDENLQNSVAVLTGDSADPTATYTLLPRGKRKDYFTGGLKSPQKGPAVNLPLGTSAPVTGFGTTSATYTAGPLNVRYTDGSTPVSEANVQGEGSFAIRQDPDNPGYPDIRADLSEATAATINQLRLAFQVQRMYERDARGGTRYVEILKAHFNVTSPDFRLQRPE